jgi:hypothetical protein
LTEAIALKEINPNKSKAGRIETNIKLGHLKLPQQWNSNSQSTELINENESNCINYYVLSFNQSNHVTNFDCLKIHPQWMTKAKNLWLFPLKQLLIPGSHCSACYLTRINSKRKSLKKTDYKQKLDVWQQLVMGIRYLDFSVGYFRSFHDLLDKHAKFWVFNHNHEILPIFPILEDVRKFVELSDEIVILDFNNFAYGFHENSDGHEIFRKLLHQTFIGVAFVNKQNAMKSFDITILQMKKAKKNVLILYEHEDLNAVAGE